MGTRVKQWQQMSDAQFYICVQNSQLWESDNLDAAYEVLTQGLSLPDAVSKFGLSYEHLRKNLLRVVERYETLAQAFAAPEREACAKVCESTVWSEDIKGWQKMTKRDVSSRSMLECASAIRARGQACPH